MKQMIALSIFLCAGFITKAQKAVSPCSDPVYRQFDFWLGQWDVYSPKGKKAGDSKISLILDSCIILEEWTSTAITNGVQ